MMTVPTRSVAEAPPRTAEPAMITPQMIQQASVQTPKVAPYRLHTEDEPQNITQMPTKNLEHIPNACSQQSGSLCFDYRAGQAVYKPMRRLLPPIPGMTPHNLSIRRDKVVAQYTFK